MLFSVRENSNISSGERGVEDLELELTGELAVVTVNRPHARNAIAQSTMDELEKVLDAVEGTAGVRALVLTGAGDRAFVSGGDLKELSTLRTEEQAMAMALRMRGVCDRIAGFPGPVVAALNGHALGGGAELAAAADIRVAADDIKIAFNQVALAIMPAWGGLERLTALVGRGRALLLAGTGELLGAAEAHALGFVDRVLPRRSFAEDWRSIATVLATRPAQEIKRITAGGVPAEEAARAFAGLWVADEHWEAAERVMNRGQ
ncbi:enoyl-CoA hydratase/isomerase family protein [Amycolatopsis lurida]